MSASNGVISQVDSMAAQASRLIDAATRVAGVVNPLAANGAIHQPGFGADQSGQEASSVIMPGLTAGIDGSVGLSQALLQVADNMIAWVADMRMLLEQTG